MLSQPGMGGSTASQPSREEKIPNDPAGGAGSSPFKSPQAWAPWTQSQPDPRQFMAPATGASGLAMQSRGPGSAPRTNPLAQSLLGGPGASPGGPPQYAPKTQAAINSNDQFVSQYQQQQQTSRSALLDALQNIAGMSTYTNPYNGYSSQGNVTY